MDINQIKNIIRVGKVSSVNPANCTARVTFDDKDDLVSYELPVITLGSHETQAYWLPEIDTQVLCVFLPNPSGKGLSDGFVIGAFYSAEDPPAENAAGTKSIIFADGSFIRFADGTVEINAAKAIKLTAPRIDLN